MSIASTVTANGTVTIMKPVRSVTGILRTVKTQTMKRSLKMIDLFADEDDKKMTVEEFMDCLGVDWKSECQRPTEREWELQNENGFND